MNVPYKVMITADGGYSREYNLTIPLSSKVLFVDDDDGTNNVEGYYFNALKALNVVYDYWDHNANGTPSAAVLSHYSTVIWACEWAFPSLDSSDRASLRLYLDGGGKLFLSGQDIGWDLADPTGASFPNEYGFKSVF
jgi:hypothetical protein